MGRPEPGVDVAKLLAQHAEMRARREASPAVSGEWRWSRSGWGPWTTEPAPADVASDSAKPPSEDGADDDIR